MPNRHRTDEELAVNKVVGQNIKYLRKLHYLNQTKVGNAIGVTFQQIQKYEKGMNGLSALRLKQLADKFKVSLDVLVDPNMITKHRGFTGNMDWMDKKPQVLVGSLDEIKDKLLQDGVDPEDTILPTLRKAASEHN